MHVYLSVRGYIYMFEEVQFSERSARSLKCLNGMIGERECYFVVESNHAVVAAKGEPIWKIDFR